MITDPDGVALARNALNVIADIDIVTIAGGQVVAGVIAQRRVVGAGGYVSKRTPTNCRVAAVCSS